MKPKISLLDFLWQYKIRIAVTTFVLFFVCYTTIAIFGFLPESLTSEPELVSTVSTSTPVVATTTVIAEVKEVPKTPVVSKKLSQLPRIEGVPIKIMGAPDPLRVVISKINVDTKISNPKSTSVAVLDENLKHGGVRYPGSAGLGAGNVFIFAHSTNHAVVINQAYKAFNNFDKLEKGDTVQVYSIDKIYTYKVESVRLATADEIFVDFSTKENMLTLSTCNTFGQKEERYVVVSSYVGVKPINEPTI